MSLRLMVVGHSYVTKLGQRKYAAFKAIDPSLELRLVVPPMVEHVFGGFPVERDDDLEPGELCVLPQYLGSNHMSYFHPPRMLVSLIREFRPDVVHIENDPYSLVGLETVLAARLALPSSRISFFTWDNLNRSAGFPKNLVKRTLTRFGFGAAKLVVCGNREAERLLYAVKHYEGRSKVLPQTGLDEPEYLAPPLRNWRDELGIAAGVPLVGYIGRLTPDKGLGDLLDALHQLGDLDFRALIVGSGEMKNEIERAATGSLAGRLVTHGPVPHADVPDLLKALDVFVLPSRTTPHWIEQFGLTLAQAMMAGIACAGSSSGAIPEVISGGGIVFPEGDVSALSRALRTLIVEPGERARIAAAGRRVALEKYTNRAVASAYLDAFREIMAA